MNQASIDMQRNAIDSWQVIRNRIGPIILSFLLIFAVAAIITYIMPRKFRGQVKMKIERDANAVFMDPMASRSDPMMGSEIGAKNEFETLTMAETLYPVVDEFNLAHEWNLPDRRAALGKLVGNLEAQAAVRSDFVTIEFYDESGKRAADIANAVSKAYMAKRLDVERKGKEAALDAIAKQLTELEQQSAAARAKMFKAKEDAGIVGQAFTTGFARTPGAEATNAESSLEGMREAQKYKLRTEIGAYESDLSQMQTLSPDQLVDRAPALQLQNATIAQFHTELKKGTLELETALKTGLGRKHPRVQGLVANIEMNKQIILDAAQSHIKGLENKLVAAKNQLTDLEGLNKKADGDAMKKERASQAYQSAKIDVEQLDQLLLTKRERYLTEKGLLDITKKPASIWQYADEEQAPAKPRVALNLALGAIVGLLFGVGLAFALEYMDTSVKSLDDVERFLGVPVLAVIPQNVGILHRTTGFVPDAEAYRILRTNIEFNRKDPNANCITVVSGGAGEGKSTTLTNLAFVCAQGGYNVLLIDADLRRPRLHTLFETSNAVGLTNYLTTDIQLEDVVLKTPVDNLYFLPSGLLPADGAGILNSQRMSDLIADVKSRFDLVLIDSPPILGVSDASVLANEADMTIIVVQHRKLPRQMLQRVKQAIDNVGGNVLGVVLNNVDIRSDSSYSYYTSYYTYYAPSTLPGGTPEKRKRRKTEKPAASQPMAAATRPQPGSDVF
jgi:polysaccharide biosynthesis transport protein